MAETEEKKTLFREDFPGYQGHVPYKYSIIGATIGSTNDQIKTLLTTEPPKKVSLKPSEMQDYSIYNRDYFCDNFTRDYPLEEDKIFSNRSQKAETWIQGDKYKIYPQHIPGVKVFVPGLYSSNLYGLPFSKSTAVAIKGNYNKEQNVTDNERYKTLNNEVYKKPKVRSDKEQKELEDSEKCDRILYNTMGNSVNGKGKRTLFNDIKRIYHSKIAQVPTVGYCGTQSVFQKQISYLNYDKILAAEKRAKTGLNFDIPDDLPPKFVEALKTENNTELPYILGYKGFRVGVKSGGYNGENFTNTSLRARNDFKNKNK